jgi:hypothetical protein
MLKGERNNTTNNNKKKKKEKKKKKKKKKKKNIRIHLNNTYLKISFYCTENYMRLH